MSQQPLKIIAKSDLPEGGFAGIIETRMVMNPDMWQDATNRKDISHGFEDFLYLANGHFKPNDGAPMHPHGNVDIVSVVLNGRIGHKGSLGDGTVIEGPGVQVQRAGSGIEHSEFNLDDSKAEIIQIWFRPPTKDLTPAYQEFKLDENNLTTVLGGNDPERFDSNMTCKVGGLSEGESMSLNGKFIALITNGKAQANGLSVKTDDLIEGEQLELTAIEKTNLIIIQSNN
ncbi:MAG: hypothetical protein DHS20C07_29610 [Methyloligella sp.]|nr:MAG: hypothetical protein DHS20C07_29610 [Methyloligella sp.]